jgi:hypothetical protein
MSRNLALLTRVRVTTFSKILCSPEAKSNSISSTISHNKPTSSTVITSRRASLQEERNVQVPSKTTPVTGDLGSGLARLLHPLNPLRSRDGHRSHVDRRRNFPLSQYITEGADDDASLAFLPDRRTRVP